MLEEFKDLFNLHIGEQDKEKTLKEVCNNITFTGANLWILACAIVIASVGLNVNSTAVIIGAMLISPLMGPILGVGLASATNDFDLLKKSLKNFSIAIIISVFIAWLYFVLIPVPQINLELHHLNCSRLL